MPVGGGVLVDRRHLLDLIDQLRVAIPANIRQARDILVRREQALADAEREATRILEAAQREVDRRLDETTFVRQAEDRAEQLARAAEDRARQTVAEAETQARARLQEANGAARLQLEEADRYALALLTRLDTQLSTFLGSIRQGIDSLQQSSPDRHS